MTKHETIAATKSPTGILAKAARSLFLGMGPILNVMWLTGQAGSHWLPASALAPVLWAVIVAWSPLPIAIPALVLQDARDNALVEYRGIVGSLVRGLKLMGHLSFSPRSAVRMETIASLIGFFVATGLVLGGH